MGNKRFQAKRWMKSAACFFIPALLVIGRGMTGDDAVDLLALMQQKTWQQNRQQHKTQHQNTPQMLLAYDPTGVHRPAQPVPPRGVPAPRPVLQIPHRPLVVTEQVIRPLPR